MGCDCNCTWKCARTTFGVIYGVVGILEVFLVIQFYFTGRPEYHSINLKSPSESIFQLLKLFAMLPGCIALLYSIKKVSIFDFSRDVTQMTNHFFSGRRKVHDNSFWIHYFSNILRRTIYDLLHLGDW